MSWIFGISFRAKAISKIVYLEPGGYRVETGLF